MTDKELVIYLRRSAVSYSHPFWKSADRIELLATTCEQLVATNEALVKERDQWIEHTKNAVWSDSEELKLANSRAERLEAALRKIGKTYPADNMRLIHSELHILNIVNTALKGD